MCSLFVGGCARETVYEEKKVPIYMVPEPPKIEQPDLPIHNLNIDWNSPEEIITDLGEIAQAYVISVRLLINWGEANNALVEAYRKMSERDFSVEPTEPLRLASGTESSAVTELEMDTESDYGTIQQFANRKFKEIEDKYHRDNVQIMQQTAPDETTPD